MNMNTHRESTLFIVGNPERADEIRYIIEDEWGGYNKTGNTYKYDNFVYYIDKFGFVDCVSSESKLLDVAVKNGWMKEFKLKEKPQFKPFDKVVARSSKNSIWFADFYSRYLEYGHQLIGADTIVPYCLPFNEQTAKLIGTANEWKEGEE